jgi:tRNA threonylcarbamoyladenosine biosynthesis protein TsaB
MRILAIDTSSQGGSVAVCVDGSECAVIRLDTPSSHLVDLGKAVSAALIAASVGVDKIDRVAIVSGPGSFTGLRVGMAYVKGLYAARGLEVVAVTSLELLARQAAAEGLPVSPMIDARKNEVYAALYDAPAPPSQIRSAAPSPDQFAALAPEPVLVEKIAPCVVPPETHIASLPRRPTMFVGSGAVRYRGQIEKLFGMQACFAAENDPDTRLLCRLAGSLEPLGPEAVVTLEPLYVRPSDVKLKPLKGVRAYDRN